MSKLKSSSNKKLLATVLAAGIMLVGVDSARTQTGALPDGNGAKVVSAKCLTCHEADLIAQQRLSRTGWTREVDKMIRWGADVTAVEKEAMVEYLAAEFGTNASPSRSEPANRAEEILQAKCLTCHETDLIQQQRLNSAGWLREVEKMIRWGAEMNDSDKRALVEYLSARFGPK